MINDAVNNLRIGTIKKMLEDAICSAHAVSDNCVDVVFIYGDDELVALAFYRNGTQSFLWSLSDKVIKQLSKDIIDNITDRANKEFVRYMINDI